MAGLMEGKVALVVDDDLFVREMISSILEELGISTVQSGDGAQALEVLRERGAGLAGVDLVVSDLNMPVMDGLELVRHIREVWRDMPIIMLTVNSEVETAVEAIRNGADDYLLKGSAIGETLPVCVAKVLEFYALKRQNRALVLELSRRNAELERLAFLDALTGYPNRRYLDVTLGSEWEAAGKRDVPLAMIMSDIDEFKSINDTYGHAFGDVCIAHAARVLASVLSDPHSFLARYGGDEFVVVLPDTDVDAAVLIAESMCRQIAGARVLEPESGVAVGFTMSFGVGGGKAKRGTSQAQLFEVADRALYQAKASGKNRVVMESL